MAGGQPESPPPGPFACEFCAEVCPSVRELSDHFIKVHIKGKAPAQEPLPAPASAFDPGSSRMTSPPVMPHSSFLPPPVAPAGFFVGGGLQPRRAPLWEPRVQARQHQATPLRDHPVVYEAGGEIRMVLLEPNHAFWAPYRMGMDAPVEIDFMGLRRRPHSPSPSFSSWLNDA